MQLWEDQGLYCTVSTGTGSTYHLALGSDMVRNKICHLTRQLVSN